MGGNFGLWLSPPRLCRSLSTGRFSTGRLSTGRGWMPLPPRRVILWNCACDRQVELRAGILGRCQFT